MSTRTLQLILISASILCGTGLCHAQAIPTRQVSVWNDVDLPEGRVTAISDQGLEITPVDPAQALHHLGWHQIQSIDSPGQDHTRNLSIGRAIWRSTNRLNRGDWTSAESLLEPLLKHFSDTAGPTTIAYFRALLRVRLDRLDRAGAAQAWIALRHAGLADETPHPELAPIYTNPSQTPGVSPTDPIEGSHALAIAWATASAPEREMLATSVDELYHEHTDENDLITIHVLTLAVYAGSTDVQSAARDSLEPIADSDDTDTGAWARYAIARSLSLRDEPRRARLGIARLLEVSIRDDRVAPILAGWALCEAAIVANRLGDSHATRTLVSEFRRRFPAHPAETTLPTSISKSQRDTTPESSS